MRKIYITVKDDDGHSKKLSLYMNKIQPATAYSGEQIDELLKQAESEYEYDYIIDRLYLYSKKRNTRKSRTYSFITARELRRRQRREIITDLLDVCQF